MVTRDFIATVNVEPGAHLGGRGDTFPFLKNERRLWTGYLPQKCPKKYSNDLKCPAPGFTALSLTSSLMHPSEHMKNDCVSALSTTVCDSIA